MSDFWDKVMVCEHENLTDYYSFVSCGTPYCEVAETRCRDCRVYITTCGCHVNDDLSGWSWARWKKYLSKKLVSV